ncbi:MAG: hypothetical protein QY302_12320 [Anaerolineales bacterium]|nr:MAG: hypothetical protein QY302_12320 [Anaerolineales bacterium]
MKSRPRLSRQFLFFVIILALVSQACAISLIEFPTFPTSSVATPLPSGPTGTPAPRAKVTFTVRLPEPLSPGETLDLSIVDEVTGLAYNPTPYTMNPVDSVTYTRDLEIWDQAVIRYRYVRKNGSSIVNEDTNRDQTIRYRLFYVSGNTQITDTISSWADKQFNTLSGSISGTVLDVDTGAPIPDILVTAGGVHSFTDAAGRFQITDLRGGTHNLVAYALDGTYQTFQQGATVAENSNTPVQEVRLKRAPLVNVTFIVSVPPGTVGPNVPIRLAGNLIQLGNTFSDLRAGFSAVADRMPILSANGDGRYSVTIPLPAGADVQYKYTMGDGFWNAEFTSDGRFVTRRILVPNQNAVIEDVVQTWQAGPKAPIVFEVDVPANTSSTDKIYIQFNLLLGWSLPIPMLQDRQNHWVYKLYGPLNITGSFTYRYCRNAQCDSADDSTTVGPNTHGKNVTPALTPQDIDDRVNAWAWPLTVGSATLVATTIPSRGSGFMAGVEYQSYYDPQTPAFNDNALQNIQSLNANWVIYTPSWTYKRVSPVVLSEQPGKDPFWVDTLSAVAQARSRNMNVALFPQPRFETNYTDFWKNAPRDTTWWNEWFERYRNFIIHFADQATQSGAQAIVIGGDWILPALPNGLLADGSPSGVPADAETRWKNLIAEVRQHFRGNVLFALPYNSTDFTLPVNILRDTDGVYFLWFVKLSDQASPIKTDMINEAGRLLDSNIAPWQPQVGKPFILGLSYPSSSYSATGCIPNGSGGCLDWTALNRPNTDISTVNLDLQQQVDIYEAVLTAMNTRSWVSGFISRGYFEPVELQDKSASVHGKPARDLLWYWFPRLLGTVQ